MYEVGVRVERVEVMNQMVKDAIGPQIWLEQKVQVACFTC